MRIELREYGEWLDVEKLAADTPYDSVAFQRRLQALNSSVCAQLGKKEALLKLVNGKVRPEDFAGVVSLDTHHQLEVAPKFLGGDAIHPQWRNDFVWLANLSRHGAFLDAMPVESKAGENEPLANLFARALLRQFDLHARRPIREYRLKVQYAFELDGDVDAEDLLLPTEDGFRQSVLHYSHHNEFNATLCAAFRALLPVVTDPSLQARLLRALDAFGAQTAPASLPRRKVPSRHARWRTAVDLAKDVLSEVGSHYGDSEARRLPGFVVDTANTWQHLLALALKTGFGGSLQTEPPLVLGHRRRPPGSPARKLNVYPDYLLGPPELAAPLVLDAKYKGRVDVSQGVDGGDIYEVSSFMRAAGAKVAILLYPRVPTEAGEFNTGEVRLTEVVDLGTESILAMDVELRGIGMKGGWTRFSSNVVAAVRAQCASVGLTPTP